MKLHRHRPANRAAARVKLDPQEVDVIGHADVGDPQILGGDQRPLAVQEVAPLSDIPGLAEIQRGLRALAKLCKA